jgi:hypothetical protein
VTRRELFMEYAAAALIGGNFVAWTWAALAVGLA